MGFPLKIGIKGPFNTCFGVYPWDSWQICSRFVVKPWINVSPNELIIPTNAYESITIQLRCLIMHYEFVTNQLRILESGVRGQYFEQLQTFATNSRSLKNWLRIQKNQLRTSRTDYDSTTNPNIYQFVVIRGIRGLCGMGALHTPLFLSSRGNKFTVMILFLFNCMSLRYIYMYCEALELFTLWFTPLYYWSLV